MTLDELRFLRELLKRMVDAVPMNRHEKESAMSVLQFVSDEITYLSHQ